MANEIQIKGGPALSKTLKALPTKLEKNILRGAMRAAAVVFQKEAQANVPVQHGDLRKSIKVNSGVPGKPGTLRVTVSAGDKKAYYAHMIEGGVQPHLIVPKRLSKEGKWGGVMMLSGGGDFSATNLFFASVEHPGVKATYFMSKAFDSAGPRALQAMMDYARQRVNKELANPWRGL